MIKRPCEMFNISTVLTTLQQEFSATANYSTLREQLPHRLVELLMCHTVLIYLRVNDTLQLASSSCGDQSGWPSAWSVVAHPNPIISIESTAPEVRAWRNQHTVYISDEQLASIATPLIYRQQSIGVLVAIRDCNENKTGAPVCWHSDEVESLAAIAGVIALLFEHTRLLEHDRERIHELSLLNSISSQMNSLYEMDYLRNIIIQRTKEICAADLCEMLEPTHPPEHLLVGFVCTTRATFRMVPYTTCSSALGNRATQEYRWLSFRPLFCSVTYEHQNIHCITPLEHSHI